MKKKRVSEVLSKQDKEFLKETMSKSRLEDSDVILRQFMSEIEESPEVSAVGDSVEEEFDFHSPEVLDMAKIAFYFMEDTDNPQWVLFHNKIPYGTISLVDQSVEKENENYRNEFISPKFPEYIFQSAEIQGGVDKVLSALKFKPFSVKLTSSKLAKSVKERVYSELNVQYKEKVAKLRHDLLDKLALVSMAYDKGYYGDHPVKVALRQQLENLGVSDPESVIEIAYSESPKFMQNLIDRAFEWMDKSPEAVADFEHNVLEMERITRNSMYETDGYTLPIETANVNPVLRESIKNPLHKAADDDFEESFEKFFSKKNNS